MHVPQQLVFPQEGDTAAALPAPETLPSPGAPVRRTSSGLRGEKNSSDIILLDKKDFIMMWTRRAVSIVSLSDKALNLKV